MRAELTRLGFQELRTPEQVDDAVRTKGTVMIVVNSVCGCAAGKARPGIALALQHARVPDVAATVFAGGDIEATERAREYLAPTNRTILTVIPAAPAAAPARGAASGASR